MTEVSAMEDDESSPEKMKSAGGVWQSCKQKKIASKEQRGEDEKVGGRGVTEEVDEMRR